MFSKRTSSSANALKTASPILTSNMSNGWPMWQKKGSLASSDKQRKNTSHSSRIIYSYCRRQTLISTMCIINVGANRFSIAETLCGQPVSICISLNDKLRIYSNERHVASHCLCSALSGW